METRISRFKIRTSDRRLMRRCLRKWGFLSSMRKNLQRKGTEQNINFWFGSAIHYAMEDYFGYNRFGDPRRAFKAYYEAFDANSRPDRAAEHYDLGIGMLTYFIAWYERHNRTHDFQTLWLDENKKQVEMFSPEGKPAVELSFSLDLGVKVIYDPKTDQIVTKYSPDLENRIKRTATPFDFTGTGGEEIVWFDVNNDGNLIEVYIVPVHYHGTIDRVVTDRHGRWWLLDYKTAKGADTQKLDTDDQISAYMWAAEQILQHKIYGFIYLQLTKDVPRPPKVLKNGDLSTDKKQKTTHYLVREELIKKYGSVQKSPNKYIEFLNTLAEQETEEGDRFIRWDMVKRTSAQLISTYNHIMGELDIMLNPNIYLFPNPTRDCGWDCPIRDVCLAMDDNRPDDVAFILDDYELRPREEDGKEIEWRSKLKFPDGDPLPVTEDEFALALEEITIDLGDDNNAEEGFA